MSWNRHNINIKKKKTIDNKTDTNNTKIELNIVATNSKKNNL